MHERIREIRMANRQTAFNLENTVPTIDFHNADEMIRANGAAEAAQSDRMQEEISEYRRMIEQLKDLSNSNSELVQKLQFMNMSTTDSIKQAIQENNALIADKLAEINNWDTRALEEGLNSSLTSSLDASQEKIIHSVLNAQDRNEELHQLSDSFNHKENVRVYRNVQASIITELQKQTQQMQSEITELKQALNETIEESQKPTDTEKLYKKAMMVIVSVVLALQVVEGFGLINIILNLMH